MRVMSKSVVRTVDRPAVRLMRSIAGTLAGAWLAVCAVRSGHRRLSLNDRAARSAGGDPEHRRSCRDNA